MPAADAEAEAEEEEEEPPAPLGATELAEAAEKLQKEFDAYSAWRATVHVHKMPAEPSLAKEKAAEPSSVSSQVRQSCVLGLEGRL